MCGEYVMVRILDVPYHADFEYTYYVPIDLRAEISLGSAVVVPFGKGNRKKSAIVVSAQIEECPESSQIKSVVSILSGYFRLDKDMLELCEFMKRQTLCTFGEAVKCMLPSSVISKARELFSVTDKGEPSATELIPLYSFIKDNPKTELKKLKEKFENVQSPLNRLVKNGFVEKNVVIVGEDKSKYETRVFLTVDKDYALLIADGVGSIRLRSQKQCDTLRLLCEYGEVADKEIYEALDTTKANLDTLEKKGLIGRRKIEIIRDPYALQKQGKRDEVTLSDEQQSALDTLKGLYYAKEPKGALLYGITGSGKTSVMVKMIDEVIKDNRGVIVLVPEISLTPQTVSTFCGYYGKRVAVIHSNLSTGERFDTYKKIVEGKTDIVIGTRSAIFAPVKNLGMIVIDEEQEHTYKSDTNPKYLAHDIARFRCAKSNALMVLASATPSLNSYYKAMSGNYTLVKMTKRYGEATLPDVIVTDMKRERAFGNMSAFGKKLAEALGGCISDGKQSILFLNRRGYHSSIGCQSCGKVVECPNCSVAMTYHSYRRIDESINADNAQEIMEKSGVLKCHYCGYRLSVPKKCEACGDTVFNYIGFGTQKTEQDLERLFEGVKTLRLDADTTTSKTSYESILGSFRNKEAEVLIGTQMVTKGHNFPLVTLVGVILADTMLYTSDYRSRERTFSMLTQVIGRAGRAKDHGIAIIQTNSPNEQTIQLAARQDYDAFYQDEIQIRRAYQFPPFCDIVLFTVSALDELLLSKNAERLIKMLETEMKAINAPALAYGPFEAPIYKTQGRYRKRILIKCKLNNKLRDVFSKVYIEFTKTSDKNFLSVDFNPSSI
ncbi:MAG: primosomal protein N' [Clostridia bacterium]|nr:primosomal protein N' [Clostridia bacterium]